MTHVGKYFRAAQSWVIECEPHVMIRIKRVFDRIEKNSHGHVMLADTIENGKELLWFLDRYAMSASEEDAAYLRARSAEYDERQQAIEQLFSAGYTPRAFNLALPLRPYQALPAEIVMKTGAVLCADDLGLGKTLEAIALLVCPGTLPALVVTLTHLPLQWKAEMAKFAPQLRVHILDAMKPYDIAAKCGGELPDVIISSYHKLSNWADALAPVIRTVVYDEAHELRRASSAKYMAAKHIGTKVTHCLGLTGTPILNYGEEIFNIMDALKPGVLGTGEEFGREWVGSGISSTTVKAILKDPRALGTYLRRSGLMIRRERKEVGREIPAVQECVHEIDIDETELNKVKGSAVELARIILSQGAKGIDKMEAAQELSWKLRQATGIGKALYVAAFVKVLLESEPCVVVFDWHREVYSLMMEALKEFNPVMYTGSESAVKKNAAKEAFVSGKSRVMLMSLRAGAGLDGLQKVCRTGVFGELDWSPGIMHQCLGRLARDGQEEPVMGYWLVSRSGSDPVVMDVLGLKSMQATGVRDPEASLLEKQAVDPDRIRKLAAAYLHQIGEPVPYEIDPPQPLVADRPAAPAELPPVAEPPAQEMEFHNGRLFGA